MLCSKSQVVQTGTSQPHVYSQHCPEQSPAVCRVSGGNPLTFPLSPPTFQQTLPQLPCKPSVLPGTSATGQGRQTHVKWGLPSGRRCVTPVSTPYKETHLIPRKTLGDNGLVISQLRKMRFRERAEDSSKTTQQRRRLPWFCLEAGTFLTRLLSFHMETDT